MSSTGHPSESRDPQSARLTTFVRSHREQIIEVWMTAVRELPVARELSRPMLLDHIPDLLERICELAERLGSSHPAESPLDLAELHARARLEEGFDLAQVVTEYRLLRSCILRLWATHVIRPEHLSDLRALDEAIDLSISASIDRYTRARDRTLQALDRIATDAFGSRNLDELLQRLLHVLQETTPAVDTAAILLREGDVLRVRAAVGLGREAEQGFTVKIGEGYAGAIAASGKPQSSTGGPPETLASPLLRAAELTTLYGIPLVEDGEVIGVAHMGSRTAPEFSSQDRRLFAALTARATSAIRQHMLHEVALRASAAAHERELELRALADNIPQLAWMADDTGARFWFNQRWVDYSGASLDRLVGWGWERYQHPAHRERVLAKYRRAFETGTPWEDTYPLRGKDGRYRWFLSRAAPIRDDSGAITRWFGTNTDITEQRLLSEVTAALTSTLDYDDMLAQLVRLAVPDLADWCVVDVVEREGVLNRVAIAHHDPAKAELAQQLRARFPPRWDAPAGVVHAIRTGELVLDTDVELAIARNLLDDEHARLLRELGLSSYIIAPLRVGARVLGAMTLATSGPDRRFQESDLATATELARRVALCLDNGRLYREAQDAIRLRENLLAIVSHELRSPLGAIHMGATVLTQHGATEARSRKPVESIRRAAERMDKIIEDLLDMATIQSGRLTVQCEDTLARELVDQIVDLHEPFASEKGLEIIRDLDVGDAHLFCDRGRIEQVLTNLLGNAKKFCRAGDVIYVRARVVGRYVEVSVEDTGPGIPPADLPRVFEPYWSGEPGARKGTGLGLFIAKALVEAHGGTLSAESPPGRGAKFTFTIPTLAVDERRR